MRTFIVLCLVAVACADKLGYNYQPVGHSDAGLSFQPGNGIGAGGLDSGASYAAPSYSAPASASQESASYSSPGASYAAPSYTAPAAGASYDAPSYSAPAAGASYDAPSYSTPASSTTYDAPSYSAPAEFEKEFFSFSAPEGEFSDPNADQKIAGSVKQGLRVVFIKGPENKGLEDAALALAKHAADQKTAIYVLNKQADIGDLANKLNAINKNTNNKPDVHFVKYRTPEDAANAQKAIQGQYDSLGGPSQSHNGGVAPVLNFASQGSPVHSATAHTPDNSYLPSSVFRRF